MSDRQLPSGPAPAADDVRDERSGFARPGLIGAGVLVAALLAAGIWLSVTGGSEPSPPQAAATSPVASTIGNSSAPRTGTSPPEALPSDAGSVCGLAGNAASGTLDQPPGQVSWSFEGRSAYPVSETAGPGRQAPEGWRSCFARTPAGAVTAAAYVLAIGNSSDYARKLSWAKYGLAESPIPKADRVEAAIGSASSPGSRVDLLGFRLLSYDGSAAQVELAMRISLPDRTGYYGAVLPLRWQAGDWKVYFDTTENPFGLVQLRDLTGYVPWSQGNG